MANKKVEGGKFVWLYELKLRTPGSELEGKPERPYADGYITCFDLVRGDFAFNSLGAKLVLVFVFRLMM